MTKAPSSNLASLIAVFENRRTKTETCHAARLARKGFLAHAAYPMYTSSRTLVTEEEHEHSTSSSSDSYYDDVNISENHTEGFSLKMRAAWYSASGDFELGVAAAVDQTAPSSDAKSPRRRRR